MGSPRTFVAMTCVAVAVASFPAIATQPAPPARAPAAPARDAPQAAKPAESAETRDTVRRMEATPAERREELRAVSRTAAKLMDQRIDELQARMNAEWSRLDAAGRARATAAMKRLRDERIAYAESMGRLDASTSAAWSDVRAGVARAYRELAAAATAARAQFDRDRSRTKDAPKPKKDTD